MHHDRATGDGEIVTAAYWVDPDTFDRWWAAHRDSWLGDGVRDGHGRWAEIIRPRVEEHETLFSSLGRPEGVAVLAEGMSGEVVEHAYWGGMRDRIPLSQTDPMLGLGAPAAEEEAGRVRVRPPAGLCLIRSGQDWTDTDGDERRMYLEDVEPVLRAGMEFLHDEGAAVGCFANRYVTVEGGRTQLRHELVAQPRRPGTLVGVAPDAPRDLRSGDAVPVHAGPGRPAAALPRGLGAAGRRPALRVRRLPSRHRSERGHLNREQRSCTGAASVRQ